jgi:hypothetical protein
MCPGEEEYSILRSPRGHGPRAVAVRSEKTSRHLCTSAVVQETIDTTVDF